MQKITFITTGDIKDIATAKRALGMANHLQTLGWKVSIIMEDCLENRHRASLECNSDISIKYFPKCSAQEERKAKNKILKELNPNFIYICAFVFRNIVKVKSSCIKLLEHSELPSYIKDSSLRSRIKSYILEYYSIIYADGILNASQYLQTVFQKRSHKIFRFNCPMLYFPYAYSKSICNINENTAHLPIRKDKGQYFFVFLGSLAKNYGTFTMIKAFEIIHSDNPNLHLLLLGKGPDYSKVVNYIKEKQLSEFIHTQGFVKEEDIAAYFTLTDSFISPMNDTIQDWARCPSKLYMYLPYKKPIITCKIGEPYEVLGNNGIYFEPSSVSSLAKSIQETVKANKWELNINPLLHEWKQRTIDFDNWIKTNFKSQIKKTHINKSRTN